MTPIDLAERASDMNAMAKRPSTPRKSLSAFNLSALGADRLSELLIEATAGDANLKRKLKLELAAEVGAMSLAEEINKRIDALSSSRTKVSWRKRPDLIADLKVHLRAIADRLSALDAGLALGSLIAWFDLYPGLASRVKDPKGELSALFFEAAPALATVAGAVETDAASAELAEAVETRLSEWGGWIGRAAPSMSIPLATALLKRLTGDRPRPVGRRALVVRKLADRAGDIGAWVAAIPDDEKSKPEVGAEIARRFAGAGLAAQARAALEHARPRPPAASVKSQRKSHSPTTERSTAWDAAEITVLDAEGRGDDAQAARWTAFEHSLDETHLKAFVSRLADFDDVDFVDRATTLAAAWRDARAGLSFLMGWPALREAAAMILRRSEDLKLSAEDTALWASRLQTRYPNAALALVRARARSLTALGLGRSDEVRALSAEAMELALLPGSLEGLPSHAEFIDSLEAAASPTRRGFWR